MDNSVERPADSYNNYPDELPIIVRRSEVLNLRVMDRGTMQEVGRVERLWMYPQAHRVLGMICKGGGLLSKKRWAYKLPQVESLNPGNLWIEGPGSNPSPEQVRQLETLIDHEIWVDGGDRLGVIVDCLFNRKTGQITQYLFVNNPLRRLIDAPNPLRPEEILSFGNHRALVSPQAVARLRRERPNLRETFSQMKQQAKAEYEQVTNQTQERVRNWGEEAKTAKERLAEQALQLKQQAAERAKALQEQAAQDILPQITEQAQELGQRVGEQYQTVQRRAQDFVEELPPLEQLGERYAAGPGRGYDEPGYDEPGDGGQGYRDQGYGGENWDKDPRPGHEHAQGEDELRDEQPQGDYRRRRRRRYRQDERQDGGLGDISVSQGPAYGAGVYGDRTPPSNDYDRSDYNRNGNDYYSGNTPTPDELTWVDEVEELPPVDPSQNPSPPQAHRPSEARRRDDRWEHRAAQHSEASAAPPSRAIPPLAESANRHDMQSRDNPWGYADSATDSDWETLAFDQTKPPPFAEPEVSQSGNEPTQNHAENSWVDQTEIREECHSPVQSPDGLIPDITPLEVLEDDDPWV